jgi:hypothetical protein
MRIDEAIRTLVHDIGPVWQWARPISWTGSGMAIAIRDQHLEIVPNAGRTIPFAPHSQDILEVWQVVDSDIVLKERP